MAKYEHFVHEARRWSKESYIRSNNIGDITDRALVIRFWDGANLIIQHEWAHNGYDPETSSLYRLEGAAVNYEQSIKIANSQGKHKIPGSRGQERDQEGSRLPKDRQDKCKADQEGGKKKPSYQDNGARRGTTYGNLGNKAGNGKQPDALGSGGKSGQGSGRPQGNKGHKLTKEQMNEYCAQGKCFTCSETGHLSKDCPQNNRLKPPGKKGGIGVASVLFADIEQLRDLKDAESLGVYSVDIEQVEVSAEQLAAVDEVLVERIPYAEDRFTIIPIPTGWYISDGHTNDSHEISHTQLLDPEFDFIMYLYNEKWKVEDQMLTENHLQRVKKRQEHKRAIDLKYQNPDRRPLGVCDCEIYVDSAEGFPRTFRMFLHQMRHRKRRNPEALTGEILLSNIVSELLGNVPYFFDLGYAPAVHTKDRFLLEYSERDFLLLTDTFHNRGYELTYAELLIDEWDARMYLECEHTSVRDAG
ncbi:hypothetical protein K438DRAFT_2065536 [Mycena galopus ATCC 62051]|nr:hypothetical protein K438DRAFT_2065536 [Mycena galopus ATCC 62051]